MLKIDFLILRHVNDIYKQLEFYKNNYVSDYI